jgi:hypothetical protein
VVQPRDSATGKIDVTPGLMIAGYNVSTTALISFGGVGGWGTGNFIIREYRGAELIAEGKFTFTK